MDHKNRSAIARSVLSVSSSVVLTVLSLVVLLLAGAGAHAQTVTFSGAQSAILSFSASSLSPIAVDAAGDIFAVKSDGSTKSLIKVGASGGETVLYDNFPFSPYAIAVNPAGTLLYFIHSGAPWLLPDGVTTNTVYVAKTTISGVVAATPTELPHTFNPGWPAAYSDPHDLKVDASGTVYIADFGGLLWKILPGSTVPTQFLNPAIGQSYDIALSPNGATVYVTYVDTNNMKNTLASYPAASFGTSFLATAPTVINSNLTATQLGLVVDSSGNILVGGSDSVVYKVSGGTLTAMTPPFPNGLTSFGVGPTGKIYTGGGDGVGGSAIYTTSFSSAGMGSQSIGSTTAVLPLQFSFVTGGKLGSISVLTQGASGLDFANAGSGSCNATTRFTASDTCTVDVTFAPAYAGSRQGAVVLKDGSGNTIATVYLHGIGSGPQVAFGPGTQSATGSGLGQPWGVATDGSGNVYIADTANGRVLKAPASDPTCATASDCTTVGGALGAPASVAVDGGGNVYIADGMNNRVLKVPASDPTCATASDCTTVGIGLNHPAGVAVDGSGNVYIADGWNDRVLKVPASDPTCATASDCTTVGIGLSRPYGVAVDGGGNVYVADSLNGRVVRVPWTGSAYGPQSTVGSGLSAPTGVAVDGNGNVYIVDQYQARAVKLDFAHAPSLSFATTKVGTPSTDSPKAVTVTNIGNQALDIWVPETDYNPTLGANFYLGNSSTCQQLSASSTDDFLLAAGASCTYEIGFNPTVTGNISEALVMTDTAFPGTQTMALSGTGQPAVPTPPVIIKAFGAASMPINSTVSLTFTIQNNNTTTTLTGIGFSDALPGGLAIDSNAVKGTCGGGTITAQGGMTVISLSGATLAPSTSCNFSVRVFSGMLPGMQDNVTGPVSSTEGGTGGTASASINVVAPPVIAEAFNPTVIVLNSTTSLTFNITNPTANTVAIAGAAFTDMLPAGLVVATPNGLTNTCGGTATAVGGATSISLTGGTIAVNASCTLTVNIDGTASGNFVNSSGAVTSTNGGTGNTATANLTVASPPTITKAFGAATISLGGTTSLTITIQNLNSNVTLQGVVFTDNLPAGLVVATPSNLNTQCAATAIAGSSSVSTSGNLLSPNGSCTISLDVQGTTPGVKTNSVQVTSSTGGTGNTSVALITVVAPPVVIKAFGAASIPLNGSTSLTFTIQNNNTTTTLTGIDFSDNLPAGLVVSAPSGLTGSCGAGTITATQGNNVISLSGATLTKSTSCTFSVNITGTAAGTKNNTTGNVGSAEGGTGGTASASIYVVAPPSIAEALGAVAIPLNGTTSLTFTITNPPANTVAITGAAFTDTLPAGLVVAIPNGLSNTCGGTATAVASSTSISLTGGTIAVNTSCIVVVNVTGTVSGQYTNSSGAVTSTNGGTGNTATANLTVASPPTITKEFGLSHMPLNWTTWLTFTIQNPNTRVTLTGLAFTDNLPAGLVLATPNNLTSSCGGTATAVAGSASVSLSGGTLATSASCTVSVNITGTTAGVKNNLVQVISTEGGAGNTSNASITVVGPPVIIGAFGAASIPLNGSTSLSFSIPNNNPITTLTGVNFSDSLPAGLVISTPNGLTGTCGGVGMITAAPGNNVISLTGATLAQSYACTFSVNITGAAAGTKNNTTSAIGSAEGGTGGTASASIDVVAPPVIAFFFLPTSVSLNGITGLSITITNPAANAVGLTGVSFTATLPAGLTLGGNATIVHCGGTLTLAMPSSISFSGASIPVNTFCNYSVGVEGTASGNYTLDTSAVASTNGGTGNTASSTVSVAAPPAITKVFGAATIPLNGATSLTFTIQNPNTNVTLTGIAFTDNLPAGIVVATPSGLTSSCGGTTTAAAGAGAVSLSGSTLATSASCTVSVNIEGTTAGVKNNSVQVISTEGGTGNTANASITVVAPPALRKAFGAASVPLNGSTSLTFTIQNNNATTTLTGVGFSDTLPAGMVISTPNALTGTCGGGPIAATQGAGVISLTGATLAQSGSCSFAVNVTGTTSGAKNNTTGKVTSIAGGTGEMASASIVVVAPPVIAKVFNPSAVLPGTSVSLTFTITNPAINTVALTGVGFTDVLPSTLTVVGGSSAVCGGTLDRSDYFPDPNIVSLSGATIAPNASCQFSVTLGTTQAGQFFNATSTVTSTNGGTGNTASASLISAFPPAISNAFSATTIPLNGETTLTFTITNPALNLTPVNGVAFSNVLPAGLVIATPSHLNSTCGGMASAANGSALVSLSGIKLAVNGACTISLNVEGTTAGVKNNTTGIVSANESGPGAQSNTASLAVLAPPVISDSFGAASITLGGTTSLTFSITNPNSGNALAGVAFANVLPAGLVVSTPDGVIGACGGTVAATAGANNISLTGATLAAGGSCAFAVNITAIHAGTQVYTTGNVTSIDGGTGGPAAAGINVIQASTTTTVVSAGYKHFGEAATFTATASSTVGTPVGSVAFLDGTTTLGTAPLSSGVAKFSDGSLTLGTHSITAQYQGNSDYIGSGSTAVSQVVNLPLITINAGSASLTVAAGQSGMLSLTIGSAGILSAPITPSCSGLPVGAQCVFSPTSVGPASLPASITLTITTTRLKVMGQNKSSRLPWAFGMLLPGICLLPFAGKRGKRRWLHLSLGLALLLTLTFAVGCGGSPKSSLTNVEQSTTPGTYTVTVTGTSSGAMPASMNINLIVTP